MSNSMDMNLSKLQEMVKDREAGILQLMGSLRMGHGLATEQQKNTVAGTSPIAQQ